MQADSKKAVLAALFGNLGIAVFKFIAAIMSRSSSMLAEAYHSASDTFNQILLLYGLHRSRKPADECHRFGHGKEQYFWSFMVAVLLFAVAGALSVREGLHKISHPEPIRNIGLAYLAILVGVVFEGLALRVAVLNLKREMAEERHKGLLAAVRDSKDPATLTVLFEDSLALIGLFLAAAAITLVRITGILVLDAVASITIGALLMIFALFLANETKKLLVGEGVTMRKRARILKCLEAYPEVNRVISLRSMHLSPSDVLVALEINYTDDLSMDRLEQVNDRIEAAIHAFIPGARVYLEAENYADGEDPGLPVRR